MDEERLLGGAREGLGHGREAERLSVLVEVEALEQEAQHRRLGVLDVGPVEVDGAGHELYAQRCGVGEVEGRRDSQDAPPFVGHEPGEGIARALD